MDRFLGRQLNTKTMMWEFCDGSGVSLPEELRQSMLNDITEPKGGTIIALARLWYYKDVKTPPKKLIKGRNGR